MNNDYKDLKSKTIEGYLKSNRERFYQIQLIENIMYIMSNARNSEGIPLTHTRLNNNLDNILGDSYTNLSEDEQDEIFNVFLDEVKLEKIGILYEGNRKFLMTANLKLRHLGETDLMESQIANFTKNIIANEQHEKIRPDKTDNWLVGYVHQFYSVGREFTLKDIFGEHWLKIGEIPRNEIGTAFAINIRSGTSGIKLLRAPSGKSSKKNGQNLYKVTYIV